MQFEHWTFEPPLGEFSQALGWFSAALCVFGWVSCAWTLFRLKAVRPDWIVWRWALLVGAIAGVPLLLGAIHDSRLDPFVSLFMDWLLGSAFGAGLLVSLLGGGERRRLGRRIIEAVALFVLGLLIRAFGAAAIIRVLGW